MAAHAGKSCAQCGHVNPGGARFCNSCGVRLEEAPPEPPAPKTVAVPMSALPARKAHAHERVAFYHTPKFYFYVFLALGIVTIVEVLVTRQGPAWFWVTALLVLSAAKFALVVMFFMHLFGDRRLFQVVFVGPLFLAGAILTTVVGIFRNF